MYKDPLEQYKHKYERVELGKTQASDKAKKINCPSCKHEVPVADLNINDKIGKCTNCNHVFSFHAEVADLIQVQALKHEVIRPEGVDIFHFKDDLEVTVKQALHPLEIIPTIFLTMFALLTTVLHFKEGIPVVFPFFFGISSLLTFVNLGTRSRHKILLDITDGKLFIQWRPKKFRKDKSFDVLEIDQIYTKKIPSSNGAGLYAILDRPEGQKHVPLISHLENHSQARFLEQEIERHLGITDRHVPEES